MSVAWCSGAEFELLFFWVSTNSCRWWGISKFWGVVLTLGGNFSLAHLLHFIEYKLITIATSKQRFVWPKLDSNQCTHWVALGRHWTKNSEKCKSNLCFICWFLNHVRSMMFWSWIWNKNSGSSIDSWWQLLFSTFSTFHWVQTYCNSYKQAPMHCTLASWPSLLILLVFLQLNYLGLESPWRREAHIQTFFFAVSLTDWNNKYNHAMCEPKIVICTFSWRGM